MVGMITQKRQKSNAKKNVYIDIPHLNMFGINKHFGQTPCCSTEHGVADSTKKENYIKYNCCVDVHISYAEQS